MGEAKAEPLQAKCPHPDCGGMLKVNASTPAGEYRCLCHFCTVRLTWAHYLDRGRVPSLALVEKCETRQDVAQ